VSSEGMAIIEKWPGGVCEQLKADRVLACWSIYRPDRLRMEVTGAQDAAVIT
jgi:hypothetical protein